MRWSSVERWLWYLFLATLAWQTRTIVWQADMVFSEWRSAALYGTDLLLVALWALALVQGWRPGRLDRADRDGIIFAVVAALSLIGAGFLPVGLYALLRMAQFAFFFIWLRHRAFVRFNADASALALVVGACVQAVVGGAQYILQSDLGLRWMGETLLTPDMRGVAVFLDLAGDKVMRAYGALPHPNVLAAYLVLALWALAWLYRRHGKREPLAWALVAGVLCAGLLATYARTVIAAALAGAAVFAVLAWRDARRTVVFFALVALVTGAVWAAAEGDRVRARASLHSTDEAVVLRVAYTRDALHSGGGGRAVNWLGVGAGNFTSWLMETQPQLPAWRLQPAHNVFLLAYAELGIIGLSVFLVWLLVIAYTGWRFWRGEPVVRLGLACLVVTFLLIGLFDHFFMTLQQGRIMFYGLLALAAGAVHAYTGRHV